MRRVLYLGSYLHITPVLVFPEVCYVDSVKGIVRAMAEPGLLDNVDGHEGYAGDAVSWRRERELRSIGGELPGSFDLLVSLNAGFISQSCGRWLKPRGYVMANSGHQPSNSEFGTAGIC